MPLSFLKPVRRGDTARAAEQRGFVFTPSGRVSLGALRNEAEGAKASGQPFNESGNDPDASAALRNARSDFAKQGQYTQRGGQQLSADQRRANTELGASGVAAIDALQPLADNGIIDRETVGQLLTKEVGNTFATQQQQRKITQEIRAIEQQVRAGRLTVDAGTKALADVHVEYGLDRKSVV